MAEGLHRKPEIGLTEGTKVFHETKAVEAKRLLQRLSYVEITVRDTFVPHGSPHPLHGQARVHKRFLKSTHQSYNPNIYFFLLD